MPAGLPNEAATSQLFWWAALLLGVAVAAGCDSSERPDGPLQLAGAAGSRGAMPSGAVSSGGFAPDIRLGECVPDDDRWRPCDEPWLATTYCETGDCIGRYECRRCGCGPCETRCSCVWKLPGGSGNGGVSGDGLEPTPEPYPGPRCPIDSQNAINTQCSGEDRVCTYPPDLQLCCDGKGEDAGALWERCVCPSEVPEVGTPCLALGLRCGDACEPRLCSGPSVRPDGYGHTWVADPSGGAAACP